MSMRLTVNGNDFGECLACDFDFAERRVRMSTCGETPEQGAERYDIHQADRLAREIADEAASSFVDTCSIDTDRDGVKWREIGEEYFEDLELYLTYLELRGQIERDAENPRLVRLIDELWEL